MIPFLTGNLIVCFSGNEYTEDILTNIRVRERSPVLRIRRTSPQLGKRSQLVNWSKDVSDKLQLHQNTFHLTIKLIDVFMDGHNIEVQLTQRLNILSQTLPCLVRILNCTWWLWEVCCWQPRWRRMGMFPSATS